MRIGLLSDAHGNHLALRNALDELAPTTGLYLFAGDSFSDSRFSNETVEALRSVGALCVAGNHELAFLSAVGTPARQASGIHKPNLDFVATLPTRRDLVVEGLRITLVHASPWPPYETYLREGDDRWERLLDESTDVVVTGHTHWPFARRVGETLVVNPGSIGCSDCPVLGDDVSWAVLDTSSRNVEFFRRPNPMLTQPL